jgi:hypothetical protein
MRWSTPADSIQVRLHGVFGWRRSEVTAWQCDVDGGELLARFRRVGHPLLRPWRWREANAQVSWTAIGRRLTFRGSTGIVSGLSWVTSRPVVVVTVRTEVAPAIIEVRYRAALGPVVMRVLSLGFFGLFVGRAEDERRWSAMKRSLEQSLSAVLFGCGCQSDHAGAGDRA